MRMPIIGITSSLLIDEGGYSPGNEKISLNRDYVEAVARNGGMPLILPVVTDPELIRRQADLVDGLILSGGYDVLSLRYGEDPIPEQGFCTPDRDEHELLLIRCGWERRMPMLGICRGVQMLNVAFGGTLYQDVGRQIGEGVLKHGQAAQRWVGTHNVTVHLGTLLHRIMGEEKLVTNSYHHQAVKHVAAGFVVNAEAADGVIEGIERPDAPFVLGLQWHPEMMAFKEKSMEKVFQALMQACQAAAE